MQIAEYKSLFSRIINTGQLDNITDQQDVHDLLVGFRDEHGLTDKANRAYCMKIAKYAHQMAQYKAGETGSARFDEMYWRFLLFEAPYSVDSFNRYIERDDIPEKRFYEPRAEKMKPIIEAYQQVYDGELDFLSYDSQ